MFITQSKIRSASSFIAVFAVIFCLFANNVYGQEPIRLERQEARTDFTDQELEMFVKAAQDVMAIQQQTNHEMVEGIEGEGLTVEEFNHMFNAMQDPQTEIDATEEEKQAFDRALQKVSEVQEAADEQVMQAVEDAGLQYHEYEEIMTAYQQDPEVQQRVNEMLEGR